MIAGSEVAPPETVEMSGQIANRADFKRVWAWVVTNGRVVTEDEVANNPGCFSSGDLSTTFRFPLAKDFIRAKESGRNVGSFQGDAFQGHYHTVVHTEGAIGGPAQNFFVPNTVYNVDNTTGAVDLTAKDVKTDTVNGTPRIANETRPKNIMQKFFIKI